MNNVYNNAFAETFFIINCLPKEDKLKIPEDFINMLKDNMNKEYKVNINPNYSLVSQNLLTETQAILKQMYLEFFATDLEKEAIYEKDNLRAKLEESSKIGIESLFKDFNSFNVEPSTLPTIPSKDNWFTKIKNWIKSLFK